MSIVLDGYNLTIEKLKAVGVNVEMRVTDWITNANALQSGDGGWNVSMTGYCSQPLLGPQQWRPLIYTHTGLGKVNDTEVDSDSRRKARPARRDEHT